MKVRTLLGGICIAVAITGCSNQAASSESKQANQTHVSQAQNVNTAIEPVVGQIPNENTSEVNKEEIVTTIYAITLKDYNKGDVSRIPFYHLGTITHFSQDNVKSFNEGHHPWLGYAEDFIPAEAANLVPDAYKTDSGIKDEFFTMEGKNENSAKAKIQFEDNFYYEVKIESSEVTGGIFYITHIDLHTFINKK